MTVTSRDQYAGLLLTIGHFTALDTVLTVNELDTYANTILADSPLGWWRSNENPPIASGTAADSSGNSRNGTYGNFAGGDMATAPSLLASDTDTSIDIPIGKTTTHVDMGNLAAFQLTTGAIEIWLKCTSPGGGYAFVFAKESAFGILLRTTSGLLVTYDWGAAQERSTGLNIADGFRHHIGLDFQSGVTNGTKMYLDGSLVLTTTITVANQTATLLLGDAPALNANYTGTFDEAAIYGANLGAARWLAHYQAGAGAAATEVVQRTYTGLRSPADTLAAATESVSRLYNGLRSAVDILTAATDSVVRALVGSRAITDSLTAASDVVTRLYQGARNLTDTLAISDSVVRLGVFARASADTLSAAIDAVLSFRGIFRSIVESLSISDAVTASKLQQFVRAVADTLTAAVDAVKRTSGLSFFSSVTPASVLGKLPKKLFTPTLNLLGSLGALLPTFAQGVQTLKAGPRVLALILKRAFTVKAGGDKQ